MTTKMEAPAALRDYVTRIGGEILNWRRAMVKVYGVSDQGRSYYVEKTLIKIDDKGELTLNRDAPVEHHPTDAERAAIKAAYEGTEFPKAVATSEPAAEAFRLKLKVAPEKWFVILNGERNGVLMCQERVDLEAGDKFYKPWTYFSHGEWVNMEPGNALPFWKPHKRNISQVMVHEGAKAARYVDWMINDKSEAAKEARGKHPWFEYLRNFEHWGINGGALAPHRADYAELHAAKPNLVVYVCDRDHPGESALQKFAFGYRDTLLGLKFDLRFPLNWDMADPIPLEFFLLGHYTGPPLRHMQEPATWATDSAPVPGSKNGALTFHLRQRFKEQWFHVVQPECYVNMNQPNKLLITPAAFNNKVSPYSDVKNTALLLQKDDAGKMATLCYAPDCSAGPRVLADGGHGFNTHIASDIRPKKGDLTPWNEYLEWLIPVPSDQLEVKRWIATIIARPGVKMNYALLLCSEQQGVGKTTLGQNILGPLVGMHNLKAPSVTEILDSQFTGWKASCRVILVNEIYEGQSVKAYNRLKSLITDNVIQVNEKFMTPYTIQNWTHILACSNHKNALKLPDDDRRWLVPEVTEKIKGDAFWMDLNRWLITGGLEAIAWWAQDFLKMHDAVLPASRAPAGSARQSMVEDGYSPGQSAVADWLDAHKEAKDKEGKKTKIVVTDNALVAYIKQQVWEGKQSDRLERPQTIRKLARNRGWAVGEKRTFIADNFMKARLISNEPSFIADEVEWSQLEARGAQTFKALKDFGISVKEEDRS